LKKPGVRSKALWHRRSECLGQLAWPECRGAPRQELLPSPECHPDNAFSWRQFFPRMLAAGRHFQSGGAVKILLWIIAIIFVIGLLVVSGVLKLIF